MRGVRINVSPVKPPEPGFSKTMRPRIGRLDARCAVFGWHLDFLVPGWLTEELMPVFAQDEMLLQPRAHGDVQGGSRPRISRASASSPTFCATATVATWVKLTGTYRMATAPTISQTPRRWRVR